MCIKSKLASLPALCQATALSHHRPPPSSSSELPPGATKQPSSNQPSTVPTNTWNTALQAKYKRSASESG